MAILHLENTSRESKYIMLRGRTTKKLVNETEKNVTPLTVVTYDEYFFKGKSCRTPILEKYLTQLIFMYNNVLSINGKIYLPSNAPLFVADTIDFKKDSYVIASIDESRYVVNRSYRTLEILSSLQSFDLSRPQTYKLPRLKSKIRENFLIIVAIDQLIQEFDGLKDGVINERLKKIVVRPKTIAGVDLPYWRTYPPLARLGIEKLIELLETKPRDSLGKVIEDDEPMNILITNSSLPDERINERIYMII